ncbi:MAG: LysM domain-containing protein [Verrucomicrobia bacterium]|nr:LysM domain-containing protein [Verrucomicrobiota bacterium]
MDNLAKATPIIAIAALVCGLVGLILGIIAFQKASQLDDISGIKDANSVISESIAGLQEEISGFSKKYATNAVIRDIANQTTEGFNQFSEQLTKIRTQSRADTIRIAELESRIPGGRTVRSSPSSSTTAPVSSSSESSAGVIASVPAGGTEYVIQSGDTFGKIAKNFGMSLDKLLTANPGVQPRYLSVGQKIVIPD